MVWGMPGELVKAGGADWVLPLPEIAELAAQAGALTCRSIRKAVRRPTPRRRPADLAAARRHEPTSAGPRARAGGGQARRRGGARRGACARRAIRACARRSSPAWRASARRKAPRPSCPICGRTTRSCAPARSTPCARCREAAGPHLPRLLADPGRRRAPAGLRARARPAGRGGQPACCASCSSGRPKRTSAPRRSRCWPKSATPEALPALARCADALRGDPFLAFGIKVASERIGAPPSTRRELRSAPVTEEEFRRLCEFLYRRTGMVFTEAKRYYVERRDRRAHGAT